MGYAGRMIARHNPWLYFGFWALMIVLLNISVICSVMQEQVSLLIGVPGIIVTAICSVIILVSFFVGAKQQSYQNKYKKKRILSKVEERLPNYDGLFISIMIAIAVLLTLGAFFYI